jgi:hypothetical protein
MQLVRKNPERVFLEVKKLTPGLLSILTLLYLNNFAFKSKRVKKIKEAAGGICEGCSREFGNGQLYASHIDHTRNANYNRTSNGKAFCKACEFTYHFQHRGNPSKIGMSKYNNASTIKGAWNELSQEEQNRLIGMFGAQIAEFLDNN